MQYYQFILLAERYYKPAEKLPSGRSPIQKAMSRNMEPVTNAQRSPIMRSFGGTPVSPKEAKRRELQKQRIGKVKRGADNPHFDMTPHPDIHISKNREGSIRIHHPKTDTVWYMDPQHRAGNKKHYEVAFIHLNNPKSEKEKVKIGRGAANVWSQHIEPRFGHGTVVSNIPMTKKHRKIYGHYNMKEKELGGGYQSTAQYSMVGRRPSSKKAQKPRATSLRPLTPDEHKEL